MKKRFLPISLLLTIILLAQTSFVVNANSDFGKYTPRTTEQATEQAFMKSIRANQETGLIDPAWLVATENSQSRNSGGLNWSSLGPDNYGSLTRGIVYDKNDATNKTIYIGTMGGGVFKSTNGGITWKSLKNNMMVSCMAQTQDGKIYIGTGDGRDAYKFNGLNSLGYGTSFVGSGLYELTSNSVINGTENWEFVNDIAVHENTVYAATNEGLYRYENNTLTVVLDSVQATGVEVCPNGTVLAVANNQVYLFKNGEQKIIKTGKASEDSHYKTIAVSPTDSNYMYISFLTKKSADDDIYMTSDQGETWQIAYKGTALYGIYEHEDDRFMLDNAIVVYPNNPRKLLIGGKNLWVMRDEFGEGLFRVECISDGSGFQIAQSGGAFYYNYKYVHYGVQTITFNPSNPNEFFVGTEGGVFKGSFSSNGYLYEGANRYFETAEKHTSVTRMFSVAFSGEKSMTLGGSLDHGTINVYGQSDLNNETTGSAIFPNDIATTDAAATYGSFDYTKVGGPCAISTINPNVMFVTTTGSNSVGTPLFRTETAGADYDKENFSYSATKKAANESDYAFVTNKGFKTPIALFENYNDIKSIDSVTYYAKRNFASGESITDVISENGYPFTYVLADSLKAGDSIVIQDMISSTFLAAVEGELKMTRDALKFGKKAAWWTLSKISGTPNALSISADGDVAYVGTLAGKLYRVSGISDAVNTDLAEGIPAQIEEKTIISDTIITEKTIFDTIWHQYPVYDTTFANDTAWFNDTIIRIDKIIVNDTVFKKQTIKDTIAPAVPSIITTVEIGTDSIFNGRAITSVAIDPKDANRVIVTLGNYGNDDYVFYSTDGVTFTSVQNNLPKVPAYSSLIESTTGLVMIGTEKGIYTSENMTDWTLDSETANVPVMEIKQQLLENHDPRYIYLIDEVGDTTSIEYPSISNNAIVYVATYGKGLYKCEDFVQNTGESINENTSFVSNSLEMNIYPNPVVSEATIKFSVEATSAVSYQIYDLSGHMVQNATLGNYAQGSHSVNFNVDGLSSGTYIVKVQVGSTTNTAKILVY